MANLWLQLLMVGAGGFVGAILRYSTSLAAQRWIGGIWPLAPPIATLAVNVAGCLAVGMLMVYVDRGVVSESLRLAIGVGLLGALTTFSTFGYETLDLLRRDGWQVALLNVGANLCLGLAAVAIGWWLASSK